MISTKFKHLKDKFKQPKSFRLELPDAYAFPGPYPGSKHYPAPPMSVVIDTIVKYSEDTNAKLEFVSTDTPITFYLIIEKRGKTMRELYMAEVVNGCRHPLDLCYFISCTQI